MKPAVYRVSPSGCFVKDAQEELWIALMAAVLACLLCIGVPAEAATLPRDTAALLSFKAAMANAPSLNSWEGDDPCGAGWDGVFCNTSVSPAVVSKVHLSERSPKLAGRLPGSGSPFWQMRNLVIFDIMWNAVTGELPEDVGQMASLQLLLLNGNLLSGPLPKSLGKLQQINRIQIDENQFSGPVPPELGDLPHFQHLHFNNNSFSGSIPPALGKLSSLLHLLLDNNDLSGPLPTEIGNISTLTVLQLDNNNKLSGSIPDSYTKLPDLRKLSMRNCGLMGPVPNLSGLPNLFFVDLSSNLLTGQLPTPLSNLTSTISLSSNSFSGSIPPSYAQLPNLQVFFCESCGLNGTVPDFGSVSYMASGNKSVINLQKNQLAAAPLPQSLINGVRRNTIGLYLSGNLDLCEVQTDLPCGPYVSGLGTAAEAPFNPEPVSCACADHYSPTPVPSALSRQLCVCAGPVVIGLRLKSPSFSIFQPYTDMMRGFLANTTRVDISQVAIGQHSWEAGPRLNFTVQIFPEIPNNLKGQGPLYIGPLSKDEADYIHSTLYDWHIPDNEEFGPFENRFFYYPLYPEDVGEQSSSLSAGVIVAVVLGCLVAGIILGTVILFLIYKLTGHPKQIGRFIGFYATRKGPVAWTSSMPRVRGCQVFSHEELRAACNGFRDSNCVGFGGYGRVFQGKLRNGELVAVKVPDRESWQGKGEFDTEIELLSRVHHRNLVNLVGFCCENNHEALVYEFVPGGTLKQHLQGPKRGLKEPLSFLRRVIIALESAQAVNYLHTAASPPIIHRDIKSGNILLDKRLHAKVADFGLSKKTRDPYDDGMSRLLSVPLRGATSSSQSATAPSHEPPEVPLPNVNEETAPSPPNGRPTLPKQAARNPDISSIKGTPGYLDPEYFVTRQLTAKSDVYSFGVVLAELVTANNAMFSMERLYDFFEDAVPLPEIVDPLMGPYPSEAMHAFALLAKHCVRQRGETRPTMADVIRSLEAILQQLPREEWETRAHSQLRGSTSSASSSVSYQISAAFSETTAAGSDRGPFHSATRKWPSKKKECSYDNPAEARRQSSEDTGSAVFDNVGDISLSEIIPR